MRWRRRVGWRPSARRTSPCADDGFSLIEVLVAITILAIIALSASQLVLSSVTAAADIDRKQTAVAIATMQMEAVRGADPAPDMAGTSALFRGRPMSQQLALLDPTRSSAAAAVAGTLAQTYPEWDSSVGADGLVAAADATVPPSGVDSVIETDGTGSTVYRDASGDRVYLTSQRDSFGTAIWSEDAAGSQPIQAVFQRVGTDSEGVPIYANVLDASKTIVTNVAPTGPGGTIIQSTVNGYPSGEITLNGTVYTTTILLGGCFVATSSASLSATDNGTCGRADAALEAAGYTVPSGSSAFNAPALPTELSGYTKLVRAIVVVQWTFGSSCSVAAPCSYSLTSAFLPNIKDLLWRVGMDAP